MKNARVLSAALLLSAAAAGSASARSYDRLFSSGTDFFLTVGYKVWASEWQTGNFTFPAQEGANSASYGAAKVASLPSVSLKYKRLFLSASSLSTGDFDFPVQTDMISLSGAGSTATLLENRSKASRKETDVNLGIYAHPALALSVGFKGITQEFKTKTRSLAGPSTIPTDTKSKTIYGGPTVGLLAGASLGAGFSAYGNFVYGVLTQKFEPDSPGDDEEPAPYQGVEIGLAYKAQHAPFSFTLGYKVQVIDNTTKDKNFKDQNVIDLTRGLVFGINLFL